MHICQYKLKTVVLHSISRGKLSFFFVLNRLLRSDGLGFGRANNLSCRGVLPTGGYYQIALITVVVQLRLNSNLQVTNLYNWIKCALLNSLSEFQNTRESNKGTHNKIITTIILLRNRRGINSFNIKQGYLRFGILTSQFLSLVSN